MPGLGDINAIRQLIQTEASKMIGKYITDEGGVYCECIAEEDLVRGEIVMPGTTTTAMGVRKNAIDSDTPIGVVYASANAGDIVKIVHAGIAYVLPNAADTATKAYILYSSSTTAGRASQSATLPAVASHNREIGHYLETGSGAGVAARAIIHWN